MKVTATRMITDVTIVLSHYEAQVLATLLSLTALHGSTTGHVLLNMLDGLGHESIPYKNLVLSEEEHDHTDSIMIKLCKLDASQFDALEDCS